MQYRTMGNTGVKVSSLGFGCMRLPVIDNNIGKINYPAASAMLNEAIDRGVTYIDTAAVYHKGQSEVFVGDTLFANKKRNNLIIATKIPTWDIHSHKDCDRLLDEQLKKLRTNYIDFYLVHALQTGLWENVKKHRVMEFLDRAKKDGRIRFACFSFHDDYEIFKKILDAYDWDMGQIQYNYMDEEYQAGTRGLCDMTARNMGVSIMEPLRGGNLARPFTPEIKTIMDKAQTKRLPAEWALRWLWNKDFGGTVLSGMSTIEQVKENCEFASNSFPDCMNEEELDIVDQVRKTYRKQTNVPCTACGYCMPCENAGVNIPKVFSYWNELAQYKENRDSINMQYAAFFGSGNRAHKCVQCGICSTHCPQQINIPDALAKAHAELTSRH